MGENPYAASRYSDAEPGAGLPGKPRPSNALAVISLVFGILALMSHCCCMLPVGAFGIGAIVTGALALNKVKDGTGDGKGMAMAGLICGVVAVVLGVGFLILALVIQATTNVVQGLPRMQ